MRNQPIRGTSEQLVVSELFHESSKHCRSDPRIVERIIATTANPGLRRIMATSRKRYPSARRIELPHDLPPERQGFDQAVLSRRSFREFSDGSLELRQVSKLLLFANGVTGSMEVGGQEQHKLRAAPSGGALYPVELYLFSHCVDDLTPALCHYEALAHELEVLEERDFRSKLGEVTFSEEATRAAIVIALTGIPMKTRLKYGERGYRFMLLEAGHIAQNILLTAQALGLGACPIGGFVDDELHELLSVDGLDEVALYLVAVGRR